MSWKSVLKADPLPWLLEQENPSVRYFSLVDLLERDFRSAQVAAAKAGIMKKGVVPAILARRQKGGHWEEREDFYIRTKYRGTVWQLIILAELGADGRDERLKESCEFILEISQDRQSGGFSYRGDQKNGGDHSCVLPCLTGNMVWSLVRLGYFEDPRVQRGIDWLTTYQRFDDGTAQVPKAWPYEKREVCWGKHTCHMGAVKALKALEEVPEEKRSLEVRGTIDRAAEYLLQHHIYKRSHDLTRTAKAKWLKFGFPTIWDLDVIETLILLTRLGFIDTRMQDAVDLALSKQDEHGRWKLENTFNGRFQVNIEKKGKPSKWVTLNALRALKGYLK